MASNGSESPDESFFNDLSQQAQDSNTTNGQETQQDGSSKVKRIACVLCRKRKLRCDGTRPTCSTCKRLNHDCAYDEVRKKSGPKRGYVKLLEQRLQQVETLLKTQDSTDSSKDTPRQDAASAYVANTLNQSLPNSGDVLNTTGNTQAAGRSGVTGASPFQSVGIPGNDAGRETSWEMIGLGLEEPLPPQEIMDDLYQIYFSKIHLTLPVIHRPRFMAALNLSPQARPPVCLRYIMWTLAASITDKYEALQEHFYQRARKYAQMDEMRGHGESTITLAHCQTWVLMATYEFRQMYFPRAWMSSGRGTRLAQMMQLHRLDGVGLDVKQCLAPPKDWTEREERRRTFWLTFCIDRYASIGTGWPMTYDEKDIMTNLPASEEAFEKSKPMETGSLDQILNPNGVQNLQALGGIVLTAAMFGRNLLHLHRPMPDDNDDDINGGFWNRHRNIERILLQTSLSLPDNIRLPTGIADPNVVFTNMCIHTSAICLHQAAIFKADKYRLPASVSNESKIRCVTAAAEIASIMRMISHMDLGSMNPFISFCIYVAARVFVQYLKTRPKDQQMTSSLQFLLQAMEALRRKNPLTESFLVQLDLDLEGAGLQGMRHQPYTQSTRKVSQAPEDLQGLSDTAGIQLRALSQGSANPLINIRDPPQPATAANTFGNGNPITPAPTSNTQYSSNIPGPPFHLHTINSIDMNAQNQAYLPSQFGSNGGFGTTAAQAFTPAGGFAFHDNEMDLSGGDRDVDRPSPATISSQSRGGSTSQSSYSPGQPLEHNIPYRASPKMTAPGSSTVFPDLAANGGTFPTNGFNLPGNMGNEAYTDGFVMGNEWEYAALNAGTGLTPMADASWDSMLESVTMGWDSVGPGHENQRNAAGV
ncbi:hypothetical protein J4E93_007689 [Alternaria ventricosa]|uniref:uncharacterized protein n=1 Tax=Alternaria ventricosa TaxID=1187951 RepID=UPI0020C2A386|nr:uncharacterized protein J4E93_007689 [Alternaria ventricosa]KAI4641592.1 hypothetical protein J4E93_007689 [Alternaria ventricosa]